MVGGILLTLYSSIAASQTSTRVESSQISSWVKCREVFETETFPLGGDALPFPFFPLALVDLWEGLTGAWDCASSTVDGGGGVS